MIDDDSCAFFPNRCVGAPRLKWDDCIRKFCRTHFNCCWYDVPMALFTARLDEFMKYFSGHEVVPRVPSLVHVPSRMSNTRSIRMNVPFFQPSNDNWW